MPDHGQESEESLVRSAIAIALRSHGEAMLRGDAVGAAAMFAQDTRWMPAGMPDVRGREEVVKTISGFFSAIGPPRAVQHTTEELYVMGDFAVEVGSVIAAFPNADQRLTEAKHRYMQLWRRSLGGEWEVIRNLLNSAEPNPS